jgi:hypothetical protein
LETGAVMMFMTDYDAHSLINVMSVLKGIIWLLLATVAEVPPSVRWPAGVGYLTCSPRLHSSPFHVTGIYSLESKWYGSLLSVLSMTNINWTRFGSKHIRIVEPRASLSL